MRTFSAIEIDCPGCLHTGGCGIWIWVNLASPLCPSVSHFIVLLPLAFLDVLWKPWQQQRRCPSKRLDVTFQKQKSRWQKKKKPLWAPKVRCKKGKGESVTVRPLFFFLTLFSCVCLTSCSHGQLWGGWTLPVGVSGRGRRCPSATYSQLPPATSHLVQGRAQDSTQQSDVSAFIYSFSFLLSVESLPSYLCLIMWILSVALFVPGALWGAL